MFETNLGLPLQDTVTGFLLAGVGNVDLRKKTNFLVVNESMPSYIATFCSRDALWGLT